MVVGKYVMTKSENFDEYMKEVGVNFMMRKLASTAKPTTEISQSGDEWNIKTSTTFKTTEIKFKLGEPFDEETADGRKCKSTITLDGNKMLHVQDCDGKKYEIVRDFKDKEMVMTLTAGNVTCTRTYEKVED